MSDVFQFRDFSMMQARGGQRINTDSCVFGGLVGEGEAPPQKILDIGTGTGVLALMLADRFRDARIIAVEPEFQIANIAAINFEQSAWAARIDLVRGSIQEIDDAYDESFDLVVCNPPFFQDSMLPDDLDTRAAKHNVSLHPRDLFQAVQRLMTNEGFCWTAFSKTNSDLWKEAGAAQGLYCAHQTEISDHKEAEQHLTIIKWSKVSPEAAEVSSLYYREYALGPLSPWMKAFRRRWYPARFNKGIYSTED